MQRSSSGMISTARAPICSIAKSRLPRMFSLPNQQFNRYWVPRGGVHHCEWFCFLYRRDAESSSRGGRGLLDSHLRGNDGRYVGMTVSGFERGGAQVGCEADFAIWGQVIPVRETEPAESWVPDGD